MDENTRLIIIKFIEVAKDILLVAIGAFVTFLAQRELFKMREKRQIEDKKEEFILDAVTFLSASTDQILKFWSEQDFKELMKIMDEGFFTKLKVISFQLRRVEDKIIWEKFRKATDLSMQFSNLLQELSLEVQQIDTAQLKKKREEWMLAEKEFVDYCVEYLKL